MELLYNLVSRNRMTKLMALLVGLSSWFYFNLQMSEETQLDVQVVIRFPKDSKGKYWLLNDPKELLKRIHVYGPKNKLKEILGRKEPWLVIVPLASENLPTESNPKLRRHSQKIKEFEGMPAGVKVVEPFEKFRLRVDLTATKTGVPVEVDSSETKWAFTPNPRTVTVRLPYSLKEGLEKVTTRQVKYKDAQSGSDVLFEPPTAGGQEYEIDPDRVTVQAKPREKRVRHVLHNVPVRYLGSEEFFRNYQVKFEKRTPLKELALEIPEGLEVGNDAVDVFVRCGKNVNPENPVPQNIQVEVHVKPEYRDRIVVPDAPPTVSITISKR